MGACKRALSVLLGATWDQSRTGLSGGQPVDRMAAQGLVYARLLNCPSPDVVKIDPKYGRVCFPQKSGCLRRIPSE